MLLFFILLLNHPYTPSALSSHTNISDMAAEVSEAVLHALGVKSKCRSGP